MKNTDNGLVISSATELAPKVLLLQGRLHQNQAYMRDSESNRVFFIKVLREPADESTTASCVATAILRER